MADSDATGIQDEAQEEKPKLALEVDIEKPSACERHVRVSISRDDVDRYLKEAYDDLRGKAEVPGFRPGRAPRKLVESRFKDQVSDQVKGSLLMDSMVQVGEDHDFSAISEPDFDVDAIEIPDEGPLTFEFDVEVRPEFDLPDWKGLELERPTREFSDEDVDKHLQKILKGRTGEWNETQGPIEEGDRVHLKMSFSHDGKELSKCEESPLVRAQLNFPDGEIEDFDKLMVGAKPGETKKTKVKLSSNAAQEELAGQEVDAEFEIVSCERNTVSSSAKAVEELGFESEEELKEAVRKELERKLAYHQQQKTREQITTKLTKDANWELPPDLLRRQSRREMDRAVMELRSSGFSDEDIQEYANRLQQNVLENTRQALHEHFILERIAESLEIDASEADFEQEIQMIAMRTQEPPRRIRARLDKSGQMDTLRNQIIERKVIDVIASEAEFTETEFEMPAQTTSAVSHHVAGEHPEEIPEAKQGQEDELREPADHN